MSHTVKIQAQFKTENLASLTRALKQFGWILKKDSKANTYSSDPARNTVYPLVAVNPAQGGYDIGIVPNKATGELDFFGDFYGGSISKSLGEDINRLKQEYACCVFEDEMTYNGYNCTRQVCQDGRVDVVAEKYVD